MKHYSLRLILLIVLCANFVACTNNRETPEDVLENLGLEEASFSRLPACEQIKVFAEVGYEFMDIEHGSVGNPSWMYDELRKNEAEVNAVCIKRHILEYISAIDQNRDLYKADSLKIHALIYLSVSLGLVTNPDITDSLKIIVCDDQVKLHDENFTVIYYLTQRDKLPTYVNMPDGLDRLQEEVCQI